jgi:hypothetical protein
LPRVARERRRLSSPPRGTLVHARALGECRLRRRVGPGQLRGPRSPGDSLGAGAAGRSRSAPHQQRLEILAARERGLRG